MATPTFTEVRYLAEDVCSVCNTPGETLDVGDLHVCGACIMLVARARAGNRDASPRPTKGRGRTIRSEQEKPAPGGNGEVALSFAAREAGDSAPST